MRTIEHLDPEAPELFAATDEFGKLLHPVQDFYAHSNWIEMLKAAPANSTDPSDLIDRSLGSWPVWDPCNSDTCSSVKDDIVVGQIPETGLPEDWSVDADLYSAIPTITDENGETYRALVTGWNPDGACPDVRDVEVSDEWCGFVPFGGGQQRCPRTGRLVHGGGPFHHERPCLAGAPTAVCLNKDEAGRPFYGDAVTLAGWQTQHEWCRLLHLTRESRFGLAASSMLMTLWAKPELPPHPRATPCGPSGPGPIAVTVWIDDLRLPTVRRAQLVFALYTSDFRRSAYTSPTPFSYDASSGSVAAENRPGPLTLCLGEADTLAATVWGWEDDGPRSFFPNHLDQGDTILRGVTRPLTGPAFGPGTHRENSVDMTVDFTIVVEDTDTDGDGVFVCGENLNGTPAVWVDFAHTGSEKGTPAEPFNTLAEGVDRVSPRGRIFIQPGSSRDTIRISKPMAVRAVGGTVTIGR